MNTGNTTFPPKLKHMTYFKKCIAQCIAQWITLGALAITATGLAAQTRYDFDYQSSDPRVLAFDDGVNTRIQLPEGVYLPTVLAVKTQGEVLVSLKRDGPYLVTDGVFTRLMLKWGNAHQVSIQYVGRVALQSRRGEAVAFSSAQPEAVYAQAARPVSALATTVVARSGSVPSPQVSGVQEALAVAVEVTKPPALTPSAPVAPVAVLAEAPVGGFDFLPSDGTISGAIRRWAIETNYELVWDLPPELDPAIRRVGALRADNMKDALEAVLKGLRAKGYPVDARLYSDRVIHFVAVTGQAS